MRLLLLLAVLWAGGLLLGVWLGLLPRVSPRIVETPPRLVLRSTAPTSAGPARLRAALLAAGVERRGAGWRLRDQGPTNAPVDFALELHAEDARHFERLPGDVRVDRMAGAPAMVRALPDRGLFTDRIALPILRAELAERARSTGVEVVGSRLRRGDGAVELQWLLARHPLGAAAPDLRPPRLEAPRLAGDG